MTQAILIFAAVLHLREAFLQDWWSDCLNDLLAFHSDYDIAWFIPCCILLLRYEIALEPWSRLVGSELFHTCQQPLSFVHICLQDVLLSLIGWGPLFLYSCVCLPMPPRPFLLRYHLMFLMDLSANKYGSMMGIHVRYFRVFHMTKWPQRVVFSMQGVVPVLGWNIGVGNKCEALTGNKVIQGAILAWS